MKPLTKTNNLSLTSFTLSALIHGLSVLAFSIWSYSSENLNLVKIPNIISINLEGFSVKQMKNLATKTTSRVYEKSASGTNSTTFSASNLPSSVAGTGAMGTAGNSADIEGPTGTTEETVLSLKQKYFIDFRSLVEAKKEYPSVARVRGVEGIVVLSVTIRKNGEVTNHKIVKESGHDILDQSALALVKRIKNFKPIPDQMGAEDIELKFPISYQLNS